jgi:two-component system, cell cycle response regulator
MRILIAEADHATRLQLRKAIEKMGYECVPTEDGAQAWDLVKEVRPDVILSGWSIAGIDALELCRQIRGHDEKHYTYFIVITDPEDKRQPVAAMEASVDDYIARPVDTQDLEARLLAARRVLSLHHQLLDHKRELERINSQLFEDGRRDPLTRIGNRLRMQEDLEALAARAIRYGHQFCLALCDIDYFKKYNDTCGHAAGDETLKAVARTLARYSRSGDMAYRFGGEEFLVVLPEQTLEGGIIALERRRRAVERLSIPHPGKNPPGPVTISAGLAVFDPKDQSPVDAVIRRADRALYLAKESGRNRVATYRQVEELEQASVRTTT